LDERLPKRARHKGKKIRSRLLRVLTRNVGPQSFFIIRRRGKKKLSGAGGQTQR